MYIYFSENSEASEFEAVSRGWRQDVYVLIEKALFQLYIYTPERLVQDFQIELEDYGYYQVDSNLVLVTSTDKETIVSTILHLYENGYFKEIKPLENNTTDLLVKIYPKGDTLL